MAGKKTRLVVSFTILIGAAQSAWSHERKAATNGETLVLHEHEGEVLKFPDGRTAILKVTGEIAGVDDLMVGTESLPAGTAIPVHSHDGYEEVIFIHAGHPRLTIGDREVDAKPGTLLVIPPGTWHGVKNSADSPTTILFVFPEPSFADFFREVGAPSGSPPSQLTPEDWARIMKTHRMRAKR